MIMFSGFPVMVYMKLIKNIPLNSRIAMYNTPFQSVVKDKSRTAWERADIPNRLSTNNAV